MKKILCLCAAVFFAANASAEVYINLNAGSDTTVPQVAYNANAGYMFNNYLGVEGGYTDVANNNYWDAAVKGVLPIPFIDLYGKLGLSYQDNLGSTGGALMYGVGLSIPIFPMFQINVEDYVMNNQDSQNFLMAGLQFKF